MIKPSTWHAHIDNFRVVPRLMVAGYGWLMYDVAVWFMALEDPTNPQSLFVSTMVGASAAVFGLYTNSGNKNKE